MVTDAFQGNYALNFHCFLVFFKYCSAIDFTEVFFCLYVLIVFDDFNKIKGANPLKVPLKTMKIIVKKRIEFLKIILGDNI
jgi:hypothetical protein